MIDAKQLRNIRNRDACNVEDMADARRCDLDRSALLELVKEGRAIMEAVACLDAGFDDRHDEWLAITECYATDGEGQHEQEG